VLFVSEAKGLRSFAVVGIGLRRARGPPRRPPCVTMPLADIPVGRRLRSPGGQALGGLAVLAPLVHYGPPPRCSPSGPNPRLLMGAR